MLITCDYCGRTYNADNADNVTYCAQGCLAPLHHDPTLVPIPTKPMLRTATEMRIADYGYNNGWHISLDNQACIIVNRTDREIVITKPEERFYATYLFSENAPRFPLYDFLDVCANINVKLTQQMIAYICNYTGYSPCMSNQ